VSVGTILHTPRLTLVPATAAHVRAELEGRHTFAALLGAAVPAGWPPGEYDAAAQRYFVDRLTAAGAAGVGWFGWYGVRRADAAAPATVVAAGGYFGPPTDAGVVELGYSVCAEWRGRGFAAELAGALAAHAARQPGVTKVIAHTTAANPASLRVLARSGFVPAGAGTEPGALRFEYVVPATERGLALDEYAG
jgi:RimJ/RimL family protein N-acetyltransferase